MTPSQPVTKPPAEVAQANGTKAPEPLSVLMGRVLADIAPVGKNSQAPANMGGYSFRGIEDVLSALKPAMAKHGVFCVPHTLERIASERPVGQNKTMFVVDLWVEWTFYGPSGDSVKADAWGCGTDMGDKATQKAMTSAFKSMLLQAFAIGDAASDSERHSVPETESRPVDLAGWASLEDEQEWRKHYTAEARRIPEEQRKDFKADAESIGLVWKALIPKAVADDVDKLIGEYLPTSPPEAPQQPETADASPLCPNGCGWETHRCRCAPEPY